MWQKKYSVYINSQVSGSGSKFLAGDGKCTVVGANEIIDNTYGIGPMSGTCTLAFTSDSREECENFVSWLNTKFTRFFVAINISKLTGIINNDSFRFVPAPPSGKFDHIYTDEELYKAFNLPQKYIDIIEAVVKERK